MEKVLEFLKGKKSYLLTAALLIFGILQGLDIFVMPEWAWPVFGALGLGFLRAGVQKVAAEIKKLPKANSND